MYLQRGYANGLQSKFNIDPAVYHNFPPRFLVQLEIRTRGCWVRSTNSTFVPYHQYESPKLSFNMWQMHWLNVYIRFTRERCNISSVNKRFTWIVATFKKAAALGSQVGFCTRWLKFCSTKAIIFLSLPSNDLDELKIPINFHLRSSRASILMKFCKSAKIVELQKKTFSRFSRSLSKTELHRKWLFGSSSLSQEKNQGQEKF